MFETDILLWTVGLEFLTLFTAPVVVLVWLSVVRSLENQMLTKVLTWSAFPLIVFVFISSLYPTTSIIIITIFIHWLSSIDQINIKNRLIRLNYLALAVSIGIGICALFYPQVPFLSTPETDRTRLHWVILSTNGTLFIALCLSFLGMIPHKIDNFGEPPKRFILNRRLSISLLVIAIVSGIWFGNLIYFNRSSFVCIGSTYIVPITVGMVIYGRLKKPDTWLD